jgi:hypothetical protein
MLRTGIESRAEHGAYDQWRARLAAEHVTKFCRLIEDLVEAHA